jgi:uncharacterized membrane protein YbhN (UPF0104 family)
MSDLAPPAAGLPRERSRRARRARTILGYVLAAAFLAWVIHGTRLDRLFANVGRMRWSLVGLGLLFDVASYACAGARWHFLLLPVGRLGALRTTQAIYAGLFLNEVLPMRVGELTRAYLVSKWLKVTVLRIVPSMAMERFFEATWLAVGIGLTTMFVPLPRNLLRSADILGALVLAGAALFVFIVLRKRRRLAGEAAGKRPRPGILGRLGRAVGNIGRGIGEIGLTWNAAAAFGATFLVFAFQAFSFWLMMVAYHFRLSFWVGMAVFLIVYFGTSLPNAPANVGAYQFFCVLGLQLFGVDKTLATGFSIVVFILLTLPLIFLGFLAMARSGLSLRSLREDLRKLAVRP